MAELRDRDASETLTTLRRALKALKELSVDERETVARAFTLMLELMNSCENAYRSHRLAVRAVERRTWVPGPRPDAIVYVMTAHPTEARSPHNIAIFHEIQRVLMRSLAARDPGARLESELFHQLELAWRRCQKAFQRPKLRCGFAKIAYCKAPSCRAIAVRPRVRITSPSAKLAAPSTM